MQAGSWPRARTRPVAGVGCVPAPPDARARRRAPRRLNLPFSHAPPPACPPRARPPAPPPRPPPEKNDFIRQIVREDLASGKHAAIKTRFPPEPNGYLHIGHAKAICLDFGIAARVRRRVQPALRRHQPGQGRPRVRRGDPGRRALARLRVARPAPCLGLLRGVLPRRREADPPGRRLRLRPQRRAKCANTAAR